MKYVSFSLWGDNPLYTIGAIKNAELMPRIYPDWKMIVYYDKSVPSHIVEKLKELDCITQKVEYFDYPSFWRFFACDLDDCEYVIFRDADSRISMREKYAVDNWIKEGASIHVMRDHPAHGIPYGNNTLGILAGMWGIKGKTLGMTDLVKNFVKGRKNGYGIDQFFLKIIYLIFEFDRTTHDDFFEKKPFPVPRQDDRFVGERINPNDNPFNEDWKTIQK